MERRLITIIKEKLEHEYMNPDHEVMFVIGLGLQLVHIDNPSIIYTVKCETCWEYYGQINIYETPSRLDSQRYYMLHSQSTKQQDLKTFGTQIGHKLNITEAPYTEYIDSLRSPLINKMKLDDIKPSQLSKDTRIEHGNDDIAFYMKDHRARLQETIIGISFARGDCPICKRQVTEKHDRMYDELIEHLRIIHTTNTPIENKVLALLQQCLIYTRTHNAGIHKGKIGRARHDRISAALRTLNKEGIGIDLLKVMFNLQTTRVGDLTYHGMELLGKPDWVKIVELEVEGHQ